MRAFWRHLIDDRHPPLSQPDKRRDQLYILGEIGDLTCVLCRLGSTLIDMVCATVAFRCGALPIGMDRIETAVTMVGSVIRIHQTYQLGPALPGG